MKYRLEFDKGYKAFKTGDLNNPYVVDTDKNREWARGWNKSYYDNLERVKQRESYGHSRGG